MQGLAPQRFEQAVGDEAGDLFAHMQRAHAECCVDGFCGFDRFRRSVIAADDLYQRQQVHRVERMAHHAALRVGGRFVELAGQQP
ncbi:hypothetical protein D3C81_1691690 [compost metagenome]